MTNRSNSRAARANPRVLMCPPDRYDVVYEINAFMVGNCGLADLELAKRQWSSLHEAVMAAGASVELLDPEPNVPDMVFTANGGLVWGSDVLLPRFAHAERQGEEPYFRDWFKSHGFRPVEMPKGRYFEGEGDVVIREGFAFMGTHARTSPGAAESLSLLAGLEVVTLKLNPKGFYHLDTCMFSDGPSGLLFYCPEAFTAQDRLKIEARVDAAQRVVVSLEEARHFACNTVILGDTAISPSSPPSFAEKLNAAGLRSVMVDLSEFMKAGGAAKCLVLHLN